MKPSHHLDLPIDRYEAWFESYPFAYASEIEALRKFIPEGAHVKGIEVGLCTGHYAQQLNITEGTEPSNVLGALAASRGIHVIHASSDNLPYPDNALGFILLVACISPVENINKVLQEAYRALTPDGSLIIGFIAKGSVIGNHYEAKRMENPLFQYVHLYTVENIVHAMINTGFRNLNIHQTLFGELDTIHAIQTPKEGYGEGSFTIVRGAKLADRVNRKV